MRSLAALTRRPTHLFLAGLALAMGGVACSGSANSGNVAITTAPTFPALRAKVFAPSCAFSTCHGGNGRAAGLDLLGAGACDTLVAKSSCLFPDRQLVVPGDPDTSFLFWKVSGEGLTDVPTGPCAGGSNHRMPLGAVALSAEDLAAVRGWIGNGALCSDDGGASDGGAGGT